jgi:FlaA1/EpsC-like NDP-sugar epimerase
MIFRLLGRRIFFTVLIQAVVVAVSLTFAWALRFDFALPRGQFPLLLWGLVLALPIKSACFLLGGLHRPLWRFTEAEDLARLGAVNALASCGLAAALFATVGTAVPVDVYVVDFLLCFLLTAALRLVPRYYVEARAKRRSHATDKGILIYGAGVAGTMLVREIRNNPGLRLNLLGFLDDDLSKRDATLMGVPVLGTGRDIRRIVEQTREKSLDVSEVVIAIPSANARQLQTILAHCSNAGIACKTVPSHSELISGRARNGSSRNLSIDDLLGRSPVQLHEEPIRRHVMGKSVLVTGAAGSIGSELCRQIALFGPEKLIAFDQAESPLFWLELELRKNFPSLRLQVEIGDIRDRERLRRLMHRERIASVFHAAAYKHVPMMEAHVLEAVKNNVLGTWNLVQAARENRVSDFLMISTDKAVCPSSVMGATKRVAEMIASATPRGGARNGTRFVSVRFGNVLGSNGSVVPIFQAQIAAGGPVTVTHPEVCRYFMTAREAVQLVLQASTMGKGGEIFVLDMGEPVRIADLARNMIQLSGFIPGKDIEILYTGLRPGEKLHEEIVRKEEAVLPTRYHRVKVFHGSPLPLEFMAAWIDRLKPLVAQMDEAALIVHMQALVPEYQPGESWRGAATTDRAVAVGRPS